MDVLVYVRLVHLVISISSQRMRHIKCNESCSGNKFLLKMPRGQADRKIAQCQLLIAPIS